MLKCMIYIYILYNIYKIYNIYIYKKIVKNSSNDLDLVCLYIMYIHIYKDNQ